MEQLHSTYFIYFVSAAGTKIKLKTRPVYLNTPFINIGTMSPWNKSPEDNQLEELIRNVYLVLKCMQQQ